MAFHLPVNPPVRPMLAKAVAGLDAVPDVPGTLYEPKWDGFRCIVFREGDQVELGSRNDRPLTRYFPEILDPLRAALPDRCVVDGELVVVTGDGLDFDALQLRLHPAESRVRKLAAETPSSFIAFDLLAVDDRSLLEETLVERRRQLEDALAGAEPPVHVTPVTTDRDVAADWFERFEGAGFDGVIAKDPTLTYRSDQRVLWKVKHHRTADCVVAGFRWHKTGKGVVGSLLLGLYDDRGMLQHVGVTSAFTMAMRKQLAAELEPLRENALADHPWREWAQASETMDRMPGGQSRWSAGKDLSWEPVRVERVCEVKYDHMQGDRFRHAAIFQRWRPDKSPAACGYDQLEVTKPYELEKVFGTKG